MFGWKVDDQKKKKIEIKLMTKICSEKNEI